MLYTILIVLLILWLLGGLPQVAGFGTGFGGNGIHLIWVIIIIVLVLALLGNRL
jgi:hypothetical protein